MNIRFVFILALSAACLMAVSARVSAQKLYPVQGPLSSHSPALVFSGHLRKVPFSAGPPFRLLKSWTLVDGEVLEGKVTQVRATALNQKKPGTAESYPPQPNLAFAWDAIYEPGYFVRRLMGQKIEQGVFKGNKGTVLQVESLDGRSGVAVDNLGNVYKMVW